MPLTNAYATLAEFKTWVGITDSTDDANLEACLNSASRWIDSYCGRRFWLDSSAVARTFEATDQFLLSIDDLGSTTGLIVKLDQDRDGTFETNLSASDYLLLPDDAPTAHPEAEPYNQIQAVGSYVYPLRYPGMTRTALVQITGKWGWPAVPDSVKTACMVEAHRLFTRRKSPEGIAGFNDFGIVRVSREPDPAVTGLLDPYRLVRIFAG